MPTPYAAKYLHFTLPVWATKLTWYCPHCRKLPQFTRPYCKKLPEMKDQFLSEAAKLQTICTCHKKAQANDKLLKSHNEKCSHGKFFHLSCMAYKRFPSNARTTWLCYECRTVTVKSRPSTPAPSDTDLEAESAGTLKREPSTPRSQLFKGRITLSSG